MRDPETQDIARFLRKAATFFFCPLIAWLPFGLLFHQQLLENAKGPSVEKQIRMSFENAASRDFELLMLGNSRIYRGLNPDRFSMPACNFSHDDDSFNQMYYKLKWLDDHGKSFRYLIAGVDFFQFSFHSDRRNYVYSTLLDDAYAADFPALPFWHKRRWVRPGLFRGLNPKHLFASSEGRPFFKANGQYIMPGTASATDTVQRSTERLPLQVKYFEKMLQHCRERNITVFLCLLPIRPEEQRVYDRQQLAEFMNFLRHYESRDTIVVDCTFDSGYTMADYTDITHLNERAADRFSEQLDDTLQDMILQRERATDVAAEHDSENTVPVRTAGYGTELEPQHSTN
ncbi:MAG: hypothetical protein R3C19_08040 [Planctomycetaceae bacterium]